MDGQMVNPESGAAQAPAGPGIDGTIAMMQGMIGPPPAPAAPPEPAPAAPPTMAIPPEFSTAIASAIQGAMAPLAQQIQQQNAVIAALAPQKQEAPAGPPPLDERFGNQFAGALLQMLDPNHPQAKDAMAPHLVVDQIVQARLAPLQSAYEAKVAALEAQVKELGGSVSAVARYTNADDGWAAAIVRDNAKAVLGEELSADMARAVASKALAKAAQYAKMFGETPGHKHIVMAMEGAHGEVRAAEAAKHRPSPPGAPVPASSAGNYGSAAPMFEPPAVSPLLARLAARPN